MPINVYLFEDHWMCREALASALGKEDDIKVVGSSGNVPEGINEALTLRPDVILMDILFGKEYLGIQATATLKNALPETNIIVFTDCNDENSLRSAICSGASGFLLKSEIHDPDSLTAAIRTVHRGDALMTPSITAKAMKVMRGLSDKSGFDLTNRELQILDLLADGIENKGIAKSLGIEIRTVANHVSNILYKMAAKNRTEAAAIARRDGLVCQNNLSIMTKSAARNRN